MVLAATALVGGVGVGACGSAGGATDEERIRTAYRDYFRAAADGDGERVCELMTTAARREVLAVSMRDDGYTLTVSGARKASVLPGGDSADGVFVIVDVRVRNHTTKVARFEHSMAQLVDAFGRVYAAAGDDATKQVDALPNDLGGRAIRPATSESGSLAFDVPKAAEIVMARFVDSLHSPSPTFTLAVELEFKRKTG